MTETEAWGVGIIMRIYDWEKKQEQSGADMNVS